MVFRSVWPTYTDTNIEQKSNKHNHLDINSEYSETGSEFEDGLHSEYAPQGAPQAEAGAAQEPATTKKLITLPLIIVF